MRRKIDGNIAICGNITSNIAIHDNTGRQYFRAWKSTKNNIIFYGNNKKIHDSDVVFNTRAIVTYILSRKYIISHLQILMRHVIYRQLFEIFESLPSLSLEKMNLVTKNAINICTCVYFTLGLFGYIAFSAQDISGEFEILLNGSSYYCSYIVSICQTDT